MKQILSGIIRHLITGGGAAAALQAYHAGDKLSVAINSIVAFGGIILSILHKFETRVRNVVETLQSTQAPNPTGTSALGCLFALLLAVSMTGCGTSGNKAVPGNHISGFIGGQPFGIDNPKNTTLRGVEITHTAGTNTFTLKIAELSSTNDPQVIDSSYAGQAAVMKTMFDGVRDITGVAIEKAVGALKTADTKPVGNQSLVNAPPSVVFPYTAPLTNHSPAIVAQ